MDSQKYHMKDLKQDLESLIRLKEKLIADGSRCILGEIENKKLKLKKFTDDIVKPKLAKILEIVYEIRDET